MKRTVNELAVVVNQWLNLTLTLKVTDRQTSQGTIDLQAVNQHTGRNHLEGWHLLDDTLIQDLVEVNGVLGLVRTSANCYIHACTFTYLVLNLALGPLLLLACLAGRGRDCRLLRRHLLPR